MIRILRIFFSVIVSIMSFQSIATEIDNITVFVTHAQLKNVVGCGENCQIKELDQTENIISSFFGQLPNDINKASILAQEKIQSVEWSSYEKEIIESQRVITDAFELGIKKYPAIIINRADVIYGITDVTKAINDFVERKEREHDE